MSQNRNPAQRVHRKRRHQIHQLQQALREIRAHHLQHDQGGDQKENGCGGDGEAGGGESHGVVVVGSVVDEFGVGGSFVQSIDDGGRKEWEGEWVAGGDDEDTDGDE